MAEGTSQLDTYYRRRCAANDLLGLSGGLGLLIKGLDSRLREEDVRGSLTEEQEERLKTLLLKFHSLAEDTADLAREMVE